MPLIHISVPSDIYSDEEKDTLLSQIGSAVADAEGVPDNPIARAALWVFLEEVPGSRWWIGGKPSEPARDVAQVVTRVSVPQGSLNAKRKDQLVAGVADAVKSVVPDDLLGGLGSWCLITEIADGNWGIGDRIWTFQDITGAVGGSS